MYGVAWAYVLRVIWPRRVGVGLVWLRAAYMKVEPWPQSFSSAASCALSWALLPTPSRTVPSMLRKRAASAQR
jgi:hypothetical protein